MEAIGRLHLGRMAEFGKLDQNRIGNASHDSSPEKIVSTEPGVGGRTVPEDRSGVQSCIVAKRATMLANGVLQRTRCGLQLRFTCDTAVASLTNAIRTITGTNLPKDHFRLAA